MDIQAKKALAKNGQARPKMAEPIYTHYSNRLQRVAYICSAHLAHMQSRYITFLGFLLRFK